MNAAVATSREGNNMKPPRALRIAVPQMLPARADEVSSLLLMRLLAAPYDTSRTSEMTDLSSCKVGQNGH